MSKGLWAMGAIVAVVGGCIFLVAGLYVFSTPRHFVGLDTPIRQDDFDYTVTAVGRTQQISNDAETVKAQGIFYIVTVRVENHARRVAFKWDERIPHIVDARGNRYDRSPAGQAVLDTVRSPHDTISPGESRSFQAVFDVPAAIERPALALDNGILMGDVFDLVAYRRVGVMLY